MAAKKEAAPRKSKEGSRKPRSTLLKISKAVKVMATMATRNGGSMRQHVLLLGAAEQNKRDNGFLVMP